MKRIGDLLTRHKTPVDVQDDVTYKQVTIRTNYKGVVLRGTQSGAAILTKGQWRVSADQFILSRIDARNGAFGIIPSELEGAIVTNDFLAFDINETEVEREFFNVFLQSPLFLEACIKASRGNTNRKRVDEGFFLNFPVNLPPISEQHRLIAKINRARAALATAEQEIAHQEDMVTKLKQAILQEAITGRLTTGWRAAQTDVEPASQLLGRIRAEKARLVATKKLRPEKPLPPIPDSEIPFALPDGWAWCRLAALGFISPRNEAIDTSNASFIPMTSIPSEFGLNPHLETRLWRDIKTGYTHVADGDVALAKITPCFENGKAFIANNLNCSIGAGTTELHIIRPVLVLPGYVLVFLGSSGFLVAEA